MLTALCCAMLTAECRLLRTLTGRKKRVENVLPAQQEASFPKGKTQNCKGRFFFSQKVCSQGEREQKIQRAVDIRWMHHHCKPRAWHRPASDTQVLRKQHWYVTCYPIWFSESSFIQAKLTGMLWSMHFLGSLTHLKHLMANQ